MKVSDFVTNLIHTQQKCQLQYHIIYNQDKVKKDTQNKVM